MLGYNVGDFGVRLIGRYYDSVLNNVRYTEGVDIDDNTVSSQTVFNVALSYRGETSSGANWVTSFNVNNITDRDPPVFA